MRKIYRFLAFSAALMILFIIYKYSFEDDFFIDKLAFQDEKDGFLVHLKDSNPRQLVNFTQFEYKIENDVCKENGSFSELLGVIIVTSYVGHDEIRSAHRQAISQEKLISMGLLRIFSVAVIPPTEKFITQEAIEHEQRLFNDLIQGNFVEAYKNLTYKHIMGLKWTSEHCGKAKFIIKMDDDIVFDPFYIQNYLSDLPQDSSQYLLAGFVLNAKKPIRLQASKWFVTRDEYSKDLYPPYLSGWLYITNRKTAHELVIESESSKFFWIDDTYVTGILAQRLPMKLTNLNKWYSANSEFLDCCIKDMKRHSYQCDYYVGPNGGDNKLIIEFIQELERCYDNACYQRQPGKSLTATCVAEYKNIIQDHGKSVVKPFKL